MEIGNGQLLCWLMIQSQRLVKARDAGNAAGKINDLTEDNEFYYHPIV